MTTTLEPATSTLSVAVVATDPDSGERARVALARDGLALVASADAEMLAPADADVVVACGSPGEEAQALVERLRERLPETPIVAIQREPTTLQLRELIRAGAHGFIDDASLNLDLGAALRTVASRQMVLPLDYHRQLDRPNLTTREKQVLGMVVMGFSNAEIATKLFLTESTVKSHLSAAFAKLGVRSRKDAAALVLDPQSSLGQGILTITPVAGSASPGPRS